MVWLWPVHDSMVYLHGMSAIYMVCIWSVNGLSMIYPFYPWSTLSMVYPWLSMVYPRSVRGLSMVYPWLSMVYPRSVRGLSMVYPWTIHGLSMVCPRSFYSLSISIVYLLSNHYLSMVSHAKFASCVVSLPASIINMNNNLYSLRSLEKCSIEDSRLIICPNQIPSCIFLEVIRLVFLISMLGPTSELHCTGMEKIHSKVIFLQSLLNTK